LLKQIDVGPRIVPHADTLPPLIKPDTIKKPDSLTTLRRRPPAPR
jgi:hypothetical protein